MFPPIRFWRESIGVSALATSACKDLLIYFQNHVLWQNGGGAQASLAKGKDLKSPGTE